MKLNIEVKSSDHSHNILTVVQNPMFTSITSAISIDLLGQVASETIGTVQISGIGGGLDFARAAHMGAGKSIVVIASTFGENDNSKIIPVIGNGSVVSLTRHDVDYVVTEYGMAELKYRSRRDKAINLINVAHPKHREWLYENAKKIDLI